MISREPITVDKVTVKRGDNVYFPDGRVAVVVKVFNEQLSAEIQGVPCEYKLLSECYHNKDNIPKKQLRFLELDDDRNANPKTDRYCVKCGRDINKKTKARVVHLVGDFPSKILHPDDEKDYVAAEDDRGKHLIGPDCAKTMGLKWSVPE